jgi:predicted nucleic acid-binding protein
MIGTNPPAPVTFIDTNIWAYAFNKAQDPRKTQRAKACIRGESHTAISTQVINELSYTLMRKAQASTHDLRRLINSLYRKYVVVAFTKPLLLQALVVGDQYQLSYWDSLIVASALSVQASKLFSKDMHNGMVIDGRLTIVNPLI